MIANNVTHEVTALFARHVASPFFQVQATSEIITKRGRRIGAGAVVVIDPRLSPDDTKMVLVGESIQSWDGRLHDGVVVGFMTDHDL